MPSSFDVRFSYSGRAVGKMRNEVTVVGELPAGNGTYEVATDEGGLLGGDATAPTPLHLFTAALTGCLMTQIRAFARRLGVELHGLRVEGSTSWQADVAADRTHDAACTGFEVDVHVDSPSEAAAVAGLVQAARRACFVEQTLAPGVITAHRLHHDGTVQDLRAIA
jgi:uncharacterized OsmC-like protein